MIGIENKIIRLLLMIIMVLGIYASINVLDIKAEDSSNTITDNSTYSVTIPSEVVITSDKEVTLTMNTTIYSNCDLEVTIDSKNTYQLVNTENETYKLSYTLSDDKLVFSNEDSTEKTQDHSLTITIKDTPKISGEYTDVLTFNMKGTNYSSSNTKHKLTFNINTEDESASLYTNYKLLNVGEAYGILPTPTRVGYNFDGWYTEASDGEKVSDENLMKSTDVTLYAHWTIHKFTNTIAHWAYGFKYNEGDNTYNGGTAKRIGEARYENIEYNSSFIYEDSYKVEIPHGYYLKNVGSRAMGDNENWKTYRINTSHLQPDRDVYSEYNYYPIDYNITYKLTKDGESVEGIYNPNVKTYNVLYGVTLEEPTRDGYVFLGWYDEQGQLVTGINEGCNATFATVKEFYEELDKRQIGNITLTAHWAKKCETTIEPNGGDLDLSHDSTIHRNEDGSVYFYTAKGTTRYSILGVRANKTGYTCTGFFDSPTDGKIIWDSDGKIQLDGKYYDKSYSNEEQTMSLWVYEEDTAVFYPQWKANTYTVEYKANANDVSGSMESSEHTYDVDKALNKIEFTREGYTFLGWSTNQYATEPEYKDQETAKNLTSENNGTVTLYAIWEKNDSYSLINNESNVIQEKMIVDPKDISKSNGIDEDETN